MTYWDEIRRKLIHLSSIAFPLVYWATNREFMLWVLIPLCVIAVLIEALRRYHPRCRDFIDRWLGRVIRKAEAETFTGATYVTIGALLAIILFPEPIAITVLLFLSISDALASLIGIRFGRIHFLGKSLAGSSAFFLSAAAIALFMLPDRPRVALLGALIGTIVEALPIQINKQKLDDNLTIPLVTGIAMMGLERVL